MINLGKCVLCPHPVISTSFHVISQVGPIHGECVMEWRNRRNREKEKEKDDGKVSTHLDRNKN